MALTSLTLDKQLMAGLRRMFYAAWKDEFGEEPYPNPDPNGLDDWSWMPPVAVKPIPHRRLRRRHGR